jgi:hypothetical protein
MLTDAQHPDRLSAQIHRSVDRIQLLGRFAQAPAWAMLDREIKTIQEEH